MAGFILAIADDSLAMLPPGKIVRTTRPDVALVQAAPMSASAVCQGEFSGASVASLMSHAGLARPAGDGRQRAARRQGFDGCHAKHQSGSPRATAMPCRLYPRVAREYTALLDEQIVNVLEQRLGSALGDDRDQLIALVRCRIDRQRLVQQLFEFSAVLDLPATHSSPARHRGPAIGPSAARRRGRSAGVRELPSRRTLRPGSRS